MIPEGLCLQVLSVAGRHGDIRIRSPFKSRRNIPRTPFSTPHRSLRPRRRYPPSFHRPLHNARIKSYTTPNPHTRIPCLRHKFLHRQTRQSFLCTPRSRPQRGQTNRHHSLQRSPPGMYFPTRRLPRNLHIQRSKTP